MEEKKMRITLGLQVVGTVVLIMTLQWGCGRDNAEPTSSGGETISPPFAITARKVETLSIVAPNKTYAEQGLGTKAPAGKVFACVQYETKNTSDAPRRDPLPSLRDGQGNASDVSLGATSNYQPSDWRSSTGTAVGNLNLAKIQPGQSEKRSQCFEVPEGAAKGMKLLFEEQSVAGSWSLEVPLPEPEAGGASQEQETIALEEISVDDMGVKLRIPRGSKTLQASAQATTYSLPLPGGLHEINVSVAGFGEPTLERAKATATIMGGTIAESTTLDGGLHEVVLTPQGPTQSVTVYSKSRSVRCTGPSEKLDVLREICRSLETT